MLDLSRIESGNLRLQPATLDLPRAGRGDASRWSSDAAQRAASGSAQELGPGTLGACVGDATRVKQILTNLLSNAVKYNVDGGRVHVASRLVRRRLRRDRGHRHRPGHDAGSRWTSCSSRSTGSAASARRPRAPASAW